MLSGRSRPAASRGGARRPAEREGPWRRAWRASWPALAVAALLRAAMAWQLANEPLAMGADRVVYDEIARALERGVPDLRLLFVSPLYPHLLAHLGEPALLAVQLLGGVAGSGVVALLGLLASGRLAVARLSGLAFAALGPELLFETQIYPTSLAVLAALTGCTLHHAGGRLPASHALVAARTSAGRRPGALSLCAAAGAAVAIAVLLSQSLWPLPFALLLLDPPARGRRRLACAAAVLVPLGLAFAAVGLRNARIAPGFHPMGLNSGTTLAHGNAPEAHGGFAPLPGSDGSKRMQHLDARRIASERSGRALDWVQVDAYWRSEALRWMRSDPAGAAANLFQKAVRLLLADPLPLDVDLHHGRQRAPLLYAAPLGWHALASLALLALVLGRAWPRPCVALFASAAASCLLFFPSERYRLAALAALCVPAALGVLALRERRRALQAAVGVGWLVLVAGAALRAPDGAAQRLARANHAMNLEWSGRLQTALALQRALHAEAPSPVTAHAIARMLLQGGRPQQALAFLDAQIARGLQDGALHNDRGVALRELGREGTARAAFAAALAATPPSAEAHLNLGRLEEAARRPARAAAHYAAYVDARPQAWHGWNSLARARLASGAPLPEVEAALERAAALAGRDPQRLARLRWLEARIALRRGDRPHATEALEAALALDPGFEPARRTLARLAAGERGPSAPHTPGP